MSEPKWTEKQVDRLIEKIRHSQSPDLAYARILNMVADDIEAAIRNSRSLWSASDVIEYVRGVERAGEIGGER